jgi:tetratricopeptide (TPR) repeat protein
MGVLTGLALTLAACGGAPSTANKTPSPIDSRLSKGIQEMAQGKKADAVATFLAVIKTQPKNHIAWYNLGVIAEQDGQATQAANDYLRSLGGDPKYVPALYNLAILETTKNPTAAVTLYQRAIDIQPNDAAAHLNLGFVLETLGQPVPGAEQIQKAIALDPSLNSRVPQGANSGA